MPNLGLHIGFALECAKRLGHPAVDDYRGSFLLGATSPDMRLFFGWRRDTTHFFELTRDVEGAGIRKLFTEHPGLAPSEALTRETVALMLGYMTHLNVDESWICQMYRGYFGKGAPLSNEPLVNVMDRAFQFDMDRRERRNIEDLEGALESIKGSYESVDVGFIDKAHLREWQSIVIERSGRDLPWERFRGFVHRVRPESTEEEADRIVKGLPGLIERVREHITEEEERRFREEAIQAFLGNAHAYLNGGVAP